MAEVQEHPVVSNDYDGPDRRGSGPLAKAQRWVIRLVRSRWIAMFAVAFAVSWSFNQVDNIGERKIEKAQRVTICVVKGVADAQTAAESLRHPPRTEVGPILQACEKREGK